MKIFLFTLSMTVASGLVAFGQQAQQQRAPMTFFFDQCGHGQRG